MDIIAKALIFDGQVSVAVIKITDIVNEIRKLQNLSNTATAALGRTLVVGAFMSAGLKGEDNKFSITINGGGPLGTIVVAGKYGAKIRGYVSNPEVEPPLKPNGKLDVLFKNIHDGTCEGFVCTPAKAAGVNFLPNEVWFKALLESVGVA